MKTDFRGYTINDDIERVDFRRVTDWLADLGFKPSLIPNGG